MEQQLEELKTKLSYDIDTVKALNKMLIKVRAIRARIPRYVPTVAEELDRVAKTKDDPKAWLKAVSEDIRVSEGTRSVAHTLWYRRREI